MYIVRMEDYLRKSPVAELCTVPKTSKCIVVHKISLQEIYVIPFGLDDVTLYLTFREQEIFGQAMRFLSPAPKG